MVTNESPRNNRPLVLVNAVGLTSRWLGHAPNLRRLAEGGWLRPLEEIVPAVTCSAQATLLTGKLPREHGVVGNGWLFRETGEFRFWQQSNALIQAEPVYTTARRLARERGRDFRAAKLFWWFNQGADVEISVTPKPYYGADGNKVFGITGEPEGLCERLEQSHGKFPFHTFWGPGAGLPCTDWIARAAAGVVEAERPDLTLVYLPHLDYDPQRLGPSGSDMPRLVAELDAACAVLIDATRRVDGSVWVVSEYGHCDVRRAVALNRVLAGRNLLTVRDGPFGQTLDTFRSRAFAVCDHQLAHVYVRRDQPTEPVRDLLLSEPGVARVLAGEERAEVGLDHPRSGELVALSEPDSWFAYPYWSDDDRAPDFARTVDIHRKPGYDPCELFLDPNLAWPKGRIIRRLVRKKLGFRTLFDVIPLDPSLVRGSHGLPAQALGDKPVLIGDGPPPDGDGPLPMTAVHGLLLRTLVPD
ncbi:Type I phosphodiesterase / nucleotide pyrophosphatase [Aquisphaera giovannonii]|uniref:Type I phosphodiesterase / nucleotide pyrophosphatase n=1 Tax=Aquisphaera giovannonii TaxID=406548 RepID=A0A5B9VZM3_9BACT|nr:nucleotide pyrophosphatase/phosphodiesterase family protein [Aquisphaera giovannonii]QEH33394.1 Type I phosphodiesterase / nucleotide pyrophosphatase [Aquisphaera giovannonii]